MNSQQQNAATFGLLKAYKLLQETSKDENHAEMQDIERDICSIFGWTQKTLSKEEFKRNIETIYELTGIH